MHCVNHPGVDVQAYCQHCGKPLCAACVHKTPSGHIYCEPCLATAGTDPAQAYWQAAQAFVAPPRGVPNPSAAAVLGLIPGVGAMYNGQLFKGLIHVIVFAVLVSITERYPVFGIFIAAWILYQSFEAYHTAKARRDGQPVPDPFGLNELGGWLNLGVQPRPPIHPGQAPPPPPTGAAPPPGYPPPPGYGPVPAPGSPPESSVPPPYTAPYTSSWGPGYEPPPYSEPFAGQNPDPYAQNYPPGYVPPSQPPFVRRGQEPFWAFILIGLGIIFLLHSLGVATHFFRFTWPILLIGLGVFMIVRRIGPFQGGPK